MNDLKKDYVALYDLKESKYSEIIKKFNYFPITFSNLEKLAESIITEHCKFGIMNCYSNLSLASKANQYKDIRCIYGGNDITVKLAREMLDANLLCVGTEIISEEEIEKIIGIFLSTKYIPTSDNEKYKKLIDQLSTDFELN